MSRPTGSHHAPVEGTPTEQAVVIGAHIDSWGLGTGALDNACNVAMVLDIARQMARLGLRPQPHGGGR